MRHLDPGWHGPPYIDIAEAIREAIRADEYAVGQRLPSRAELAAHFGVAPMTAANAVRLLASEGLVTVRPGQGATVAAVPDPPRDLQAEVDDLKARVTALEQRLTGQR